MGSTPTDGTKLEVKMDQGSIYGDFDAEEEIARILLIEIEKEIAANGSVTWAEFCEKDKLGR